MISFFVVNEVISMISWVFGYVYVITGGGPGFATQVLELYIWKNAFAYQAFGVAVGCSRDPVYPGVGRDPSRGGPRLQERR